MKLRVTTSSINRRKTIPADFSDKTGIVGTYTKGFIFEGLEVPHLDHQSKVTWYQDQEGMYLWAGALEKVEAGDTTTSEKKFISSEYWWINNYSIPSFWNMGITGLGAKIAVLDSGLSLPHPDLAAPQALLRDVSGSDSGVNDQNGHGTHCYGLINASNNGFGATGVAYNATVFFGKITNDEFGDDLSYLTKGIRWAIEQGVDIISISNGKPKGTPQLQAAVADAAKQGILVVCAAGNKMDEIPSSTIYYPARYPDTISVGGITKQRIPLSDSFLTNETTLFAPGENLYSTHLNKGYLALSGSSQATAFVAGVCALLLEKIRKKDPAFKAIGLRPLLIKGADTFDHGIILNGINTLNLLYRSRRLLTPKIKR